MFQYIWTGLFKISKESNILFYFNFRGRSQIQSCLAGATPAIYWIWLRPHVEKRAVTLDFELLYSLSARFALPEYRQLKLPPTIKIILAMLLWYEAVILFIW